MDGALGTAAQPYPLTPAVATERDLAALEERLGHRFADRGLLEQALTHVSGVKSHGNARVESYQRLEFLGDRVLGLVVAEALYRRHGQAEEGELSLRLSGLVRKEACVAVARGWELGPFLRLGAGEALSGGRKKETILADACEAVLGAVFLDGGLAAARKVVLAGWAELLAAPPEDRRDPKTRLQERLQARGLPPPTYREVARSGPDHRLEFVIAAEVPGLATAEGRGRSKREAEQAAARAFLLLPALAEEVP